MMNGTEKLGGQSFRGVIILCEGSLIQQTLSIASWPAEQAVFLCSNISIPS